MREEASSGRRAARGWTACCVLGRVRLGDPASVLPGVLRGIGTTREPAGGRGPQSLREQQWCGMEPTRGGGWRSVSRQGRWVCLSEDLFP